MRLFERLHERGQHHHPGHPRARHRRPRAPHDPHPRRQDRERRAAAQVSRCRSLRPRGIALASLRANKLRSFLTVLGILIGVSSVIAVVAITEGLDRLHRRPGAGAGLEQLHRPEDARHHHQPRAVAGDEQAQGHHACDDLRRRARGAATPARRWGRCSSPARTVKCGRTTQEQRPDHGHHRERSRASAPCATSSTGRHLIEDDIDRGAPGGGDRRRPGGRVLRRRWSRWARRSPSTATSCAWWAWRSARARSSARARTTSSGCRSPPSASSTAAAAPSSSRSQARVHGRVRGGAGPGARGHARAPPPRLRQGRRLQHRDRRERHGALAERHPRHLRGDHRGHRHQPARGRRGGHEHHAGLGHRAHPRDRRAQGAGRAPARHPAPVPGGVGGALALRRRAGRAGRGRCFSLGWPPILGGIMSADFSAPVRLWAVLLALFVSSAVGLVAGHLPGAAARPRSIPWSR